MTHSCQNETLLWTWAELLVYRITIVYILPFIMMVKTLKSDNPNGTYAHLTIEKYEMEKSPFKACGLSLGQWPIGPKIIKITELRL